MSLFRGKTVFITGASRGIGKAIGLKLASEGANIVIAAKTAEPHPKLPGTIYTAAEETRAEIGALKMRTESQYMMNLEIKNVVREWFYPMVLN